MLTVTASELIDYLGDSSPDALLYLTVADFERGTEPGIILEFVFESIRSYDDDVDAL